MCSIATISPSSTGIRLFVCVESGVVVDMVTFIVVVTARLGPLLGVVVFQLACCTLPYKPARFKIELPVFFDIAPKFALFDCNCPSFGNEPDWRRVSITSKFGMPSVLDAKGT